MSGVKPLNLRNLGDGLGKRKVIFILALVITSLVVTGFVWAQKKVVIVADGKNISVTTFRYNAEGVLAQASVYLGPNDEYRMSTSNLINGTTIEVYRAVPVTVKFQDKTETITTGKPTVGELAANLGYTKENSKTLPGEETRITAGMQINILAVNYKTVSQKMPVAPPDIRQPDASMEKGAEEVQQEGAEGLKEVLIKQRFEDGQLVSAETVAEKVITVPAPRIIKVGTRDTVDTSRGSMRFRETYWMEATAYTPTDGSSHGITASGLRARHGIVAVDPSVIPLGTRLFIPDYGFALAADTGGDIVGSRIDLCVESHSEAWSFGRQTVKVYVIAD